MRSTLQFIHEKNNAEILFLPILKLLGQILYLQKSVILKHEIVLSVYNMLPINTFNHTTLQNSLAKSAVLKFKAILV